MNILEISPYFPYKEYFDGVVLPHYHVGGVQRHVWELSQRMAKRGHTVDVITSGLNGTLTSDTLGVMKTYRIPVNLRIFTVPISAELFPFLVRYMKSHQIDILHAHTPVPFYSDVAAIACRICKVPFVITVHNDILGKGVMGSLLSEMYNCLFGILQLESARRVIVTTRSYKYMSRTVKTRFIQKTVVIPNAVDTSRFSLQDKQKAKTKLDFDGKKVVLYVGYLGDYKGLSFLIETLPHTKDIPNLHLVVVGQGPLRNRLELEAQKLGVLDKTTFAGHVEDRKLPLYYSAADVFVLPSTSRAEGFGIVQLEAMASGVPVVATSVLGVSEVAEEAALIATPRDSQALARAICAILGDENLAREMGRKGRHLVEEKYSWEIIVDQILELFRDLSART